MTGSKLEHMVGVSAGKLAHTNVHHPDTDVTTVLDAAGVIWENLMSSWVFVELWMDGTTLWDNPEGTKRAFLSANDSIRIESI